MENKEFTYSDLQLVVDPATGGKSLRYGKGDEVALFNAGRKERLVRENGISPFLPGFFYIGFDKSLNGDNGIVFLASSYGGGGGSITESKTLGDTFYPNTVGAPIWAVFVTNGGTGATVANGAAITGTTGGGGTGFTGTVQVSGGVITGITITSGGTGYNSQPTAFTFASGDAGAGFAFVCRMQGQGVYQNNTIQQNRGLPNGSNYTNIKKVVAFNGSVYVGGTNGLNGTVQSAYVRSGGTGYTNGQQAITFTGGAGTGATGIALVVGGAVVAVHVVAGGSGYTGIPTVAGLTGGSGAVIFISMGARSTIWKIDNYVAASITPGLYWEWNPVIQGKYGVDDFIPTALNVDERYIYYGEYGSDVSGGQTGLAGGPGVYRSANGTDWEQIFGPVAPITAWCINSGTYVATYTSTGGVRNHCHAVYPDPFAPGHIYISCGDGGVALTNMYRLGVSYDYGKTWSIIETDSKFQNVQLSADANNIWATSDNWLSNVFILERGSSTLRTATYQYVDQLACPFAAPRFPGPSVLTDVTTTSGSATITSASAQFDNGDVWRPVSSPNLPPGQTYIESVTNSTTAILTRQMRSNGGGDTLMYIGNTRWAWPGGTGGFYGIVDPVTGIFYLGVQDSGSRTKNSLIGGIFALDPISRTWSLIGALPHSQGLPLQEIFIHNGWVFLANARFPLIGPMD